jgi:prophage tail gpP-like protein
MPEVILKVDGMKYAGWKSIDIRRSLDHAADTFSLSLTDRWSGTEQRRPIRMGSPCVVWIDDQKLITGHVDDVNLRYNATERTISVEGRSKVADMIDCSLPLFNNAAQFNGLNFPDLAKKLAKEFNIDVIDEVGKFKPKRNRVIDPGSRVFEFLEEWSRVEAVFMTSNIDGDLIISRASNKKVNTALELGKNIKEAEGRFSMKERFSLYHYMGQPNWSGNAPSKIDGRAEDLQLRYRPTVVVNDDAENLGDIKRRAEWQRNISYGRSQQATYTVLGWHHADGLWEPNRLVRIVDEWMGLDGVWWLISAVRFRLDENGQKTELTVMPKEAFDLIPLPPKDKKEMWTQPVVTP